jgi:hypothetical protein
MLAGAASLGALALLVPVLGEEGWSLGWRLRHAGVVVLLVLTLLVVWQFNGFVLMA